MLLRTKGIPLNIEEFIVGRITRDPDNQNDNSILISDDFNDEIYKSNFLCYLTSSPTSEKIKNKDAVYNIPTLEHLKEGDIVVVGNDGNIKTLYRVNSFHNTILATERCNSNCLMCSQPPRDKNDIERLFNIHEKLIPLIPKDCFELCITGGEPTLMGNLFLKLLDKIKFYLPDTELHVLTNGRAFAWNRIAELLAGLNYDRLMLGIPLYADYYQIHDYIVQARNAFNQTILGIHNLNRYGQRIEIRVVLHKQSIPRLTKLSRYIYKNLPFAEHVTFMGLEFIGYTPHNIDKLWIDPCDYMEELSESVEYLADKGIRVSIYNTQLCVLPRNLWKYAKRSISDWKQSYLTECENCKRVNECGGLFEWNKKNTAEE